MLGELTPEQINAVLFNEVVGRIGCHGEGRTSIIYRIRLTETTGRFEKR